MTQPPAELTRVLDRMMTPPDVQPAEGFTARVLVPPGELYDPLFMRVRDGEVWINDDGGQEGVKGGQIMAIARDGSLSAVVPLGRMLPAIGFDIAPASFGSYGGQIFTVALPEPTGVGAAKNNVVERIVPETQECTVFCTLPNAGTEGKGVSGDGLDALFAPDGTPFEGRLFCITVRNNTIYQVTADGGCGPFITFDQQEWGKAWGMVFPPGGRHMLVSVFNDRSAAILRVTPDGKIDGDPLVRSSDFRPTGMAFAPETFGEYAGQLFINSLGGWEGMQQTHAPPSNGRVFRLTPDGELKVVVAGMRAPLGGMLFLDEGLLWVADVNGDFVGGRELPDGFVVEVALA